MKKVVFIVLVLVMMLAMALPALAEGYCPGGFLQVDKVGPWSELYDGSVDENADDTMCVKVVDKRFPGGGGEERVIAMIDNIVPVEAGRP